jgi:hypothetical protein
MIPRWVTPMRPSIFLGLLAYFVASCLAARVINGDSERIADPWAALLLASTAAIFAVFSIAPVVSSRARAALLRTDVAFGGSKWTFLLSGTVAAAFTVGFLVLAARGLLQ